MVDKDKIKMVLMNKHSVDIQEEMRENTLISHWNLMGKLSCFETANTSKSNCRFNIVIR